MSNLTYKGSGVDYDMMDPFKILCQKAGIRTVESFKGSLDYKSLHFQHCPESVGESVYLQQGHFKNQRIFFGHVHEGLGTKNLVADEMYKLTGKTYYDQIAKDTVAMGVNDMATLGISPNSVAMHLSAGSSDWFLDEKRNSDLVNGWADACIEAGAIWACGETPTLKDVLIPGVVELSVSTWGSLTKLEPFSTKNINPGDEIIFLESSGIHANGLTLARKIANLLPDGYNTPVYDTGLSYGEMLLTPTHIYVPIIDDLLLSGVKINYAVNITGHGWRKLMRASGHFDYFIEALPSQNPIFDFIQEKGNVDEKEMYGNYNMGAGFALFVKEKEVHKTLSIISEISSIKAIHAGFIGASHTKRVIIKPKKIIFNADNLKVR